jgi:hypothetical protein
MDFDEDDNLLKGYEKVVNISCFHVPSIGPSKIILHTSNGLLLITSHVNGGKLKRIITPPLNNPPKHLIRIPTTHEDKKRKTSMKSCHFGCKKDVKYQTTSTLHETLYFCSKSHYTKHVNNDQ